MHKLLAVTLIVLSAPSLATCWIVEGVSGSNYAKSESYKRLEDGYSGKFSIMIDGKRASVLYDGIDAGGMFYQALSKNTVIGVSGEPNKHAMETWLIQDDGRVLMTKTLSGFGGFDSAKAMVGKVTGSCN